jgi:hypothetical protein
MPALSYRVLWQSIPCVFFSYACLALDSLVGDWSWMHDAAWRSRPGARLNEGRSWRGELASDRSTGRMRAARRWTSRPGERRSRMVRMDRGEPEVGPDAGRTWSGLLRSWSWTGRGSRKPVQLAVLLLLSSLFILYLLLRLVFSRSTKCCTLVNSKTLLYRGSAPLQEIYCGLYWECAFVGVSWKGKELVYWFFKDISDLAAETSGDKKIQWRWTWHKGTYPQDEQHGS